jgi:hypothetical protein
MTPEKFSEQTFDPIAPHRFPQTAGHHQPQPREAQAAGGDNDPEVARMEPLTLGLRPEEIRATAEPLRLGETSSPFNGGVRGS